MRENFAFEESSNKQKYNMVYIKYFQGCFLSLPESGVQEGPDSKIVAAHRVLQFKEYIVKVDSRLMAASRVKKYTEYTYVYNIEVKLVSKL